MESMECKVVDVRKVSTRFGERLVVALEHNRGVDEVWLTDLSYPIKIGDSVPVEITPSGKLRIAKNKSSSEKSNGSGKDNGDAVAELVDLFRAIRNALPDESSEAIAKLAITLFLRK